MLFDLFVITTGSKPTLICTSNFDVIFEVIGLNRPLMEKLNFSVSIVPHIDK